MQVKYLKMNLKIILNLDLLEVKLEQSPQTKVKLLRVESFSRKSLEKQIIYILKSPLKGQKTGVDT